MTKSVVFAALLILFLTSRAEACYTAREVEAEQGIRIHSELMVIGLTCVNMPRGQELFNKYQYFTSKNASWISSYEADLIHHYADEGLANPEQQFHALRSELANEISRKAVTMSTANFCQQFAPRIDQALAMDDATLRRWARQVWPGMAMPEEACN